MRESKSIESHEIIDTMEGSACCLLCGTLEDPFVGCEHKQEMLYMSMRKGDDDILSI